MAGQVGYSNIDSIKGTAQIDHKASVFYPEIPALIRRHAYSIGIVPDRI